MPDEITLDGDNWLPFDIDAVGFKDAIAVEDYLGTTWLKFLKGLSDKDTVSARHLQAVAWLARHPDEPELQIVDVEAAVAKVSFRSGGGDDDDPLPSESADSNDGTESSSTSSMESNPGSGAD